MDKDKGNAIIATWLGYKYYPVCKVTTWYYECERYKWNELDDGSVWVLEPTEEFDKTPCVSSMYWEYERDIEDDQWKDYKQYLHYDSSWNELMPVIDKIEKAGYRVHIVSENWYDDEKDIVDHTRIQQVCRIQNAHYIQQVNSAGIDNDDRSDKLKATWKAVVKLIEEINKYRQDESNDKTTDR